MTDVLELIRENAGFISVLSIAIACDIFTGVIKAIINHDLKSSKFKEGVLKKWLDYVLVVISFCLDYTLHTDYLSTATLYCLIAMEFYSCIENLRYYIPIPATIENALNVLQQKSDTTDIGSTDEDDVDEPATEEVEEVEVETEEEE